MTRMAFDPKNKAEQVGDFPRIKFELNERKRIICLEDPVFAYVHTLRAPKVVDGRAVMEEKKRRSGETYTAYSMDFLSRVNCLGDQGILEDKGIDPKNCPACNLASSSDMADAPERRFAMHVIVYSIRPGGFDITTPFSCQTSVWAFTDRMFNKLTDFVAEWGTLRNHDLLLGPCTDKNFQKFEIAIASRAAWQETDPGGADRKALVVETFRQNQTKDLEAFCGRKVDRRFLEDDLATIQARWRVANGVSTADGTEGADALADGLEGLLADTVSPSVVAVEDTQADDLFTSSASASPVVEPSPVVASPEVAESVTIPSFDDLLKEL